MQRSFFFQQSSVQLACASGPLFASTHDVSGHPCCAAQLLSVFQHVDILFEDLGGVTECDRLACPGLTLMVRTGQSQILTERRRGTKELGRHWSRHSLMKRNWQSLILASMAKFDSDDHSSCHSLKHMKTPAHPQTQERTPARSPSQPTFVEANLSPHEHAVSCHPQIETRSLSQCLLDGRPS